MLRIDYRSADRRAVLQWDETDEATGWIVVIRRILFDSTEEPRQDGPQQITVPWWSFVSVRPQLLEAFRSYGLQVDRDVVIGVSARALLAKAAASSRQYANAGSAPPIAEAELEEHLRIRGFTRQLTPEQLRNVAKLVSLPSGASFSVPGAGKTTEALAVFFYRATSASRLLVIAPKNAFASWEEQLTLCVPEDQRKFVRLRGGLERIALAISLDPPLMLITYQQLVRVRNIIADHIASHDVFMILDESHRIKSGTTGQSAQATLSVSHLPIGKLILSGTPMPQSAEDLIPQFNFLYPEVRVNDSNVIDLMRTVYVRTTKEELGLPPITRSSVPVSMSPNQTDLYRIMRNELARDVKIALSTQSRLAIRSVGRSVTRLLQFVSNPMLLASHIAWASPEMLSRVLAEGDSPKLRYVFDRTRRLTKDGHKVLIWTSFVGNVEYVAERLLDLGAVYIHGGVDAGDQDDDESREGKIRLFHDDPRVKVMVANPAAAAEGISLHQICHHALYLDRTFNAAHYLQSEDRIHRLGLASDQSTVVEIIMCRDSIDEVVDLRLRAKINAMADALNDRSLRIEPLSMEAPVDDPGFEDGGGMSMVDLQALAMEEGLDGSING